MLHFKKNTPQSSEEYHLPHIESHTAITEKVKVPRNRRALFLALDTELLRDDSSDELSFAALSRTDKVTFQLLLYLTYCCKGELLQVTLENPESGVCPPQSGRTLLTGTYFVLY